MLLEICKNSLTANEYAEIYLSVGWEPMIDEHISIALANSNFKVCIKDDGQPIGMGRVIGDGIKFYVIYDVAVLPNYQGKGIGKIVINAILEYISEITPEGYGACVQLISTKNNEGLYEKLGFGRKPGDGMGHGMMTLVKGVK
ncbi:MAG: GNAT family N-acetyltransferase [Oscillospiraceae bacterium]|nr:GNAT family N-acetyltransferase [Oscillospiraceae bacterium]